MANFIAKIKGMKMAEFKFSNFIKNVTIDDNDNKVIYLEFELDSPIPKVVSSLSDYKPGTNERVHDFRTDVMKVRCRLPVIEANESEFVFDEDKDGNLLMTGSYGGDLFLDISRSGEVWLTDVKFSGFRATMRKVESNKRVQDILARAEAIK